MITCKVWQCAMLGNRWPPTDPGQPSQYRPPHVAIIFGAQFVGARPVEFDEGWCDAPRRVAAPGSQSG